MGQYFLILNLDRKEFLHPHKLSMGLKLWEICANHAVGVLPYLLRKSSEGGGGDVHGECPNAGRWAGDRIAVVGDYDESGLYQEASNENETGRSRMNETLPWKDISLEIRKEFEVFLGQSLDARWDR